MKTFRNNTQQTEEYISGTLRQDEALLFDARLLIDPVLKMHLGLQRRIRALVHAYGRKKTREEIAAVHEEVFNDPRHLILQQQVNQLFNKS